MTVTVKPNFENHLPFEALKKGDIAIYPEFKGPWPKVSSAGAKSTMIQKQSIERLEMGSRNKTTWPCSNPWLIKYTAVASQENCPRVWSQDHFRFEKVEGQLKAGFTLEFNDREDGNKGLQKVYGLHLQVPPWSQPFATRRSSPVTSRSQMLTQRCRVGSRPGGPEDDKQLFPPSRGTLMKEALLKKHPELKAHQSLAGKITAEQMSQMNYCRSEGKSATQVARDFWKRRVIKN